MMRSLLFSACHVLLQMPKILQPESRLTFGVLLMLGAFLCFALMDTSAKWLVTAAIPAIQVAFLRYFFHFSCAMAVYAPRHGWAITQSKKPQVQALRAVFLLSATTLNFSALKYLPLTLTIGIFFAAPLVVCLLSRPVLGEIVGIRRLSAVLVGFIGVLVMLEPWGESFDWHVILAIGAMLCASGYFVMSRLVANVDGNAVTQFFTSGIAMVALAPFALWHGNWPDSAAQWGLGFLLGALGMLGHSMLTRAHRYAEASVLAPTVYSQMIYIAILSWVVFGQPPESHTILGTVIVVSSGLYIWARERKKAG